MVLGLAMNSCKKNDDDGTPDIEIRDRTEQYLVDIDSIEKYLRTHFYNYEEFDTNPDAKIVFDTISAENGTDDKISIFDSDELKSKMVDDAEGNEYKLYYLEVRKGEGQQPKFADSAFVQYTGTLLNNDVFDNSPNPVWFDLVSVVQGFREVGKEFKGATSFVENPDGTITHTDFGIGAMFIPSGLAYYASPPVGVFLYSPLIFTFQIYGASESDHDFDHIPSYLEDINGDENYTVDEDDTDEDNLSNFLDPDDDGDGIFTRNELQNTTYIADTNLGEEIPDFGPNEYEFFRRETGGVITVKTATLVDSDGNNVWDYLQEDIDIDYSDN